MKEKKKIQSTIIQWAILTKKTLNPGRRGIYSTFDIDENSATAQRVAIAWASMGNDKFFRAARGLKGKHLSYFMTQLYKLGRGYIKPDKFEKIVDQLLDKKSDLYKHVSLSTTEKIKKLWNKYFG